MKTFRVNSRSNTDTSLKMLRKQLQMRKRPPAVAHPLCPDLCWDHGLLGSDGGHEVLLGQEVQRKLNQEASDFAQLLLSAGRVRLGQPWPGLELLQLGHVPHQGRRKATEHLRARHRQVRCHRKAAVLATFAPWEDTFLVVVFKIVSDHKVP